MPTERGVHYSELLTRHMEYLLSRSSLGSTLGANVEYQNVPDLFLSIE